MDKQKEDAQKAQALAFNLNQKEEIDQKVKYYSDIIKTYSDLSDAIADKILIEKDKYTNCKFILEKLDVDNIIFCQKAFFEMWLLRSAEYEKKFSIVYEDCDKNFADIESQARELAKTNAGLNAVMIQFDEKKDVSKRIKVEYYALLSYEVLKSKRGKETLSVVK